MWRILRGMAGVCPIILADQVTKYAVCSLMEHPSTIKLTSFFNIVYVKNKGISFGLFPAGSSLEIFFLLGLATAVLIFLGVWYVRASLSMIKAGLILIMAGAVGNMIDRIRYGGVVDFLDFHVSSWHFPAFNLADSVITVGVLCVLFSEFMEKTPFSKNR